MPGDENSHLDRAGNLLGALSLVVVDRTFDAIAEMGEESSTAAIALSALNHFLDRPTIDMLRRVLGLTSSGAVRLVDRLETRGWVKRGATDDGRATAVILTAAGRRIARRVSQARASALMRALSGLSPTERQQFEALASQMLVGMMRGPGAVRWICRLCNMEACGWASGGCPVRNAASDRYSVGDASRHT